MDTGKKDYIYFPGLNGLRCIGAGFVFISHLEQIKEDFGLVPHYWNFTQNKFGTITFLVLSGFLISHLLFLEKEKQHTICIGNFYLRRMLRIWPVYYLIVLISLFILNRTDFFEIPVKSSQVYENFGENLLFYSIMLPNLVMIPYAAHTWTIGLIEQFYLIYPLMLKQLNKSGMLALLLICIIFSPELLAAIPFSVIFSNYPRLLTVLHLITYFSISFSCIAIGCAAYLMYWQNAKILRLIYKPVAQIICCLLLCFFLFFSPEFNFITDNRIYAILLSCILLNIATNPTPLFTLENSVYTYLGKVSYGIYMYHPVTIVIALQLLKIILPGSSGSGIFNILLYVLGILFTILIATLSYYYIELPFLKLKGKLPGRNQDAVSSNKLPALQPKPMDDRMLTR